MMCLKWITQITNDRKKGTILYSRHFRPQREREKKKLSKSPCTRTKNKHIGFTDRITDPLSTNLRIYGQLTHNNELLTQISFQNLIYNQKEERAIGNQRHMVYNTWCIRTCIMVYYELVSR